MYSGTSENTLFSWNLKLRFVQEVIVKIILFYKNKVFLFVIICSFNFIFAQWYMYLQLILHAVFCVVLLTL